MVPDTQYGLPGLGQAGRADAGRTCCFLFFCPSSLSFLIPHPPQHHWPSFLSLFYPRVCGGVYHYNPLGYWLSLMGRFCLCRNSVPFGKEWLSLPSFWGIGTLPPPPGVCCVQSSCRTVAMSCPKHQSHQPLAHLNVSSRGNSSHSQNPCPGPGPGWSIEHTLSHNSGRLSPLYR